MTAWSLHSSLTGRADPADDRSVIAAVTPARPPPPAGRGQGPLNAASHRHDSYPTYNRTASAGAHDQGGRVTRRRSLYPRKVPAMA